MLKTLNELWELTGESLSKPRSDWNGYFDPIGLILHGKVERASYWCTPKNSITFASTGGDGVHYGLLDVGQGYVDESPVVMTVPMCDNPNTIVGSDLLDFLALGCRQGYFSLEQLIYQREAMLAVLDSGQYDVEAEENEIQHLETISRRFSLRPWKDHAIRLHELEREYHNLVRADTEPM